MLAVGNLGEIYSKSSSEHYVSILQSNLKIIAFEMDLSNFISRQDNKLKRLIKLKNSITVGKNTEKLEQVAQSTALIPIN